MKLVALCGYATSGKDSAAVALVKKGWARVAFADSLKEIASELGWDGEKDDHGRWFLQQLGQSVREHVALDAWVQAAHTKIKTLTTAQSIVITDCRYRNEAMWVRRLGGKVVRIERPGTGPVNAHISESDMDGFKYDAVIQNVGSVESLGDKLVKVVNGWWPNG